MADWTQNMQPYHLTFNADTFTYSGELRFSVTNMTGELRDEVEIRASGQYLEVNWADGISHPQPPSHMFIQHYGYTAFNVAYDQRVELFIVGRRVENRSGDDAAEVVVAYEGRVIGTHWLSHRVSMTSEPLLHSLQANVEGTFDAIGSDFQGVARQVPIVVRSVGHVISLTNYGEETARSTAVSGLVNENGWLPPWNSTTTLGVGKSFYYGISSSAVDRRTRTVMFTHDFVELRSRAFQDVYRWRPYEQIINETTGKLDRTYDVSEKLARIYEVAGQAPHTATFGDLLLGPVLF